MESSELKKLVEYALQIEGASDDTLSVFALAWFSRIKAAVAKISVDAVRLSVIGVSRIPQGV